MSGAESVLSVVLGGLLIGAFVGLVQILTRGGG